jgi:hypothetical protein
VSTERAEDGGSRSEVAGSAAALFPVVAFVTFSRDFREVRQTDRAMMHHVYAQRVLAGPPSEA